MHLTAESRQEQVGELKNKWGWNQKCKWLKTKQLSHDVPHPHQNLLSPLRQFRICTSLKVLAASWHSRGDRHSAHALTWLQPASCHHTM